MLPVFDCDDCNKTKTEVTCAEGVTGAGQKTPEINGRHIRFKLVSQSEKMAFRFAKIFSYLQPIRLVSFKTEGGKMLQAHSFDFEAKTLGKRQHFTIVLKENN